MKRLILLFLFSVASAQAAHTEFVVQPTGSYVNAGSDTNDAAELTFTGGNWVAGTGVFTAAGADLSGVTAGEWASVYPDGAAIAVFVGRITAVDDGADTITVSLSAKSGTAPTDGTGDRSIKVGGAWKGFDGAIGFPAGFIQATATNVGGLPVRVNIRDGLYNVFTNSGSIAIADSQVGPITWEGFSETFGDGGNPMIAGTNGSAGVVFKLVVASGAAKAWVGITFLGNFNGTPTGGDANGNFMVESTGQNPRWYRCTFTGAWRMGFQASGTSDKSAVVAEECLAYGNNADDASDFAGFGTTEEATFLRCVSVLNLGGDSLGFYFNSASGEPSQMIECISAFNGNSGVKVAGTSPVTIYRSTIHGNGADGIFTTATALGQLTIVGNIISSNASYGVESNVLLNGAPISIRNNAFWANATGTTNNINASHISGSIILTGDPFTDAANGDFSPNDTAGAGASVRGAGIGTFLTTPAFSSTTVSHRDIGAAQHEDTEEAGGGTTAPSGFPFMQ